MEKKQVLLLGDSIRLGYCAHVKELQKGVAEVIYPEENCRSTQYVIMNLRSWAALCDPKRVKVVHFNCGHWDAESFLDDSIPLTSLEEYEKNLRKIVSALRSLFPQAKLICATTTPMNPDATKVGKGRSDEDIRKYNKVVYSVMKELDVVVNDLFEAIKDLGAESFVDYCHMTPAAYQRLALCVNECLTKNM